MQQYAVVFFPKINDEKLKIFITKYNPQGEIIPPHLTIVSPISELKETELIERIEENIKDIESFPIHLSGLTKSTDNCLFLVIKEGNEKIINLRNKLYSGILASYIPTDFPFIPHITLGAFISDNDKFNDELCTTACIEAQDLNFDVTCMFGEVAIIKGDGISSPLIVKTFNLKT